MEKVKVMSSHYPEKVIDYNEWANMFKVGSRIKDVYRPTQRVEYITGQYDTRLLHKMVSPKKDASILNQLLNVLIP